jgi:amino acid adenylation domain-containing protein
MKEAAENRAVASGPETGDFPLSPGQKALWFLDRLAPGNAAYVLAAAARVKKGLEPAELLRAVEALVQRHPALRTTFDEGPDGPYQRVHERLAPEVIVADVSDEADVNEIAWRPFDLQRGPLLRVALLRLESLRDVLVISVHHIVCDFWSAEVMARDLGVLLSRAEALPALPLRYTDCVRRAAERLAGPEGERLWSFWSQQLGGELPRLELPTDRPRPLVRTWAGGAVSARVAPEVVERLHALSKGAGATFFTTLTAAFQAFLGRYTRQEDVLIGSPTAGRTHRAMAGVVGYFVNPVVLRGDLSGDPTFAELLARTKTMVLAALAHRGFPFPVLAERLVPERDPSRQPVFDVMFAFQRERSAGLSGVGGFALGEGGDAAALGALEMETLALEPPATDFDLSLMGAEMDGSLALSLRYSAELFDRTTAERLLAHFGRLLAGIAQAPESRLSDLPLLDEAEREQLLAGFNQTALEHPREPLLHELILAQVERTPDAVALVHDEERLTYREIAERSARMAARLRAAGVGPEVAVGICLDRKPALLTSLLGVLRAGGFYVPLDPNYPKERLSAILDDSGAPVLVTEERCLPLLPETGARIVRADLDEDAPALAPLPELTGEVRARRLAYTIYTSGSTGRPKGVAITHRNVVALAYWSREVYSDEEFAGVLGSTSICFDMSVFELFVTLAWGGTVILAENALELPELPAKNEVTLINTVPSAMSELVRLKAVPPSVRTVNLGGEPLRGALARRIHDLGMIRLYNVYGPSEDTTFTTWADVGPEGEPTIGRPLANERIYVLDDRLSPVPVGVPGEIYVSGEGVTRGYLGRPDRTAEKYLPDPFGSPSGGGARMYRVGDLGRWRPDGELEYLGRIDFQLKIRGFRVEPGEIEALLLSHAEVREAVVVAREQGPGDLRLVAFVVPKSGEALPGLRPFLRERLPEHMVPWAIVPLAALPLLPNGKVDRKALVRMEVAPEGLGEAAGGDAPRNAAEELLVRLWCEVLGLPEAGGVGIHDNFFSLGGHSLLATQLVSRLREALGVELPLRQIFETPTVADLARVLPGLGGDDAPARSVRDDCGEAPLSFAQERLWFLDRFERGSAAYNMPSALRIRGDLDVAALAAAFGEIARRHEVLRTGFPESGGRPVQRVRPWRPWPLPVADVSALPEEGREAGVARRVTYEATQPFDLTRPPLLRTALLRLGPSEHVLVVVLHHIVADGWSIGVLLRELTALYAAFHDPRRASRSPLPELPCQYADFAVWQRDWLRGEVLEEQLAWWRRALAGAPETLDLPADRRRPQKQSHRGARLPVALADDLAAGVAALARDLGATPFMVLLAAFQTLLSRLSGQRDLVVGSPIANRNRLEIEPLIGCFVNTLALRLDLSADPAFGDLVGQVREVTLGAYAHQDLPFERLVEELVPARDASRTPVFQVVFALQNAPAGAPELPGLEAEPMTVETGIAKFDLSLVIDETPSGALAGTLEYATDLFDAATMERWAGHLLTLLRGIVAEPAGRDRRVSELPLLGPAEREQIARAHNRYDVAFPSPRPLHRRFEAMAARSPESLAVSFEGEEISYGDLDRWANRIARRLRRMGVEPESRVGLFVHRSISLVAGLLGILKAGGAYVPIDPDAPPERAAFVLADSGVRALVTEAELSGRLVDLQALPRLLLDTDREEIGREDGNPFAVEMPEEAAAYIIYTSGSTGQPKGVVVSHGSAARLFDATREWFGFTPEDVWTLFHSIAFDFSVWELWGALAHGGRLVVVPYWVSRSPEAFLDLLARERVTVLNQTPSAFRQLVREDGVRGQRRHPPELALRFVVFGGEALELSSLAPWIERRGDTRPRLINMYGITETTVHVTFRPIVREDVAAGRGSVIGEPIPDLQVYLLDEHLEPVPPLVGGEIHVGGAGLAQGYLGRPELTAARFVPDPFGPAGSRLYRSGDLARRISAGANDDLEYLGRIDQQVKIRGFRIELGEIEATLAAHPAVREAVVLPRSFGSSSDARLVAWLIAEGDVTPLDLHRFAASRLPSYMVPSAFVRLDRFPLTVNGKLDPRALPDPADGPADLAGEYAAPRNPAEEVLAGLWAEVLGVERVGLHDNFFTLGGHSLLATQLVSRVREALGVELPLRRFFESPTVAGVAEGLDDLRPVRADRHEPVRQAAGERPLSFAQERLWFLDRFAPGSALYNMPAAVRFEGELGVAALAAAFGEVVRRHEVLRTALVESVARRPVQRVAPWNPWKLPVADLTALPAEPREAEWRRLAAEEATRPFDLGRPPMLRTLLVRSGEREHVLAATFHHVAADGWSLGVFLRELAALYQAFSEGRPSPLPELPLQYADYAAWQRDWLQGPVLEEQTGYWRQALADAPGALDLPADHPRPAVLSQRGRQREVRLPADLSAELVALGRRLGATPFMVMLAGFQTLLSRISGQDDVVAGSPIANRNRLETEGLIGFFVNTLALRLDLAGDPPFEEVVRRAREVTLGAYAHQDLPFEKLVEELVPTRDPSRTPIFQVLFALQNAPMGTLELAGLRIETVRVETGTSKFDLSLLLEESEAGFQGFVEYSTDLFEDATVDRLLGHLRTLLAGIVADPRSRVWDLPLLGEGEREQVLDGLNQTALEHPRDPLLHEMILDQVARAPDAVALVYREERLTYREIAGRSARMAARLRAAGVGPEVAVGVCLDRTPALLVSLLGVLRAGGFYVPLDPNYPKDRLEAILDDSGAPVLVTEERCLPLLPETGARIVRADLDEDVPAPSPLLELTGEVRARRLAYTIYTSGSTGRPKGVAITHRNVVALTYWSREVYSDEEFAGVLGSTSICFDMSIFELFVTLAWGGTVILAENALELPELPARDEVTLINTVPSAMSELVRLKAVPPSVRTVNLGGEPLRGALARRIHELGTIRLYNVYGPSEDTTFTTWADVGDVRRGGEPTIGRPLANTRIYILDRNLRPVPVGVPGEVYISGEGVTRGYLGRPDMTAEKYIPDPFVGGGARMYRVGDLGRWRADGELDYLGRLDHQVKIRGFRVELGDIEAALLAHPGVREAVVVTREPVPGDLRLAAFVVLKPGEDMPDLRGHLKERLPEYMVPWALVPLDELPLLPNGKVNRRALTRMELALGREGAKVAGDEARTPVEELLAGLWREVLGLPEGSQVGVHDNFFSLGGHSLLATQLVSRLRETLGVELPLRRFFENPTVAELAQVLPALGGTEAPAIRPVPRREDLPLSFAQERLWFIDRFEPGSTMYNIPAAARLRGDLDVPALATAIGGIVRRHEVLRTGFAEVEGRPVQRIAPWAPLELPLADLSGLPVPERDREVRRILDEDVVQPFDLGRPPMLRAALLRLAADEHVLLLDFHHIASDGWSIGVFLREMTALYADPAALPELEVQYADFAQWQREWMRGDVLMGQLDYWWRALAGAPPVLELPMDRPRTGNRGDRGDHRGEDRRSAERRFTLSAPLVAELSRFGQSQGATLFSVLTAGLQALLARLSGQTDVVLGSPIANRNRLETEPLIGFFVNVLALRLDLSGDPPFRELTRRAREAALGAYSHQDLPFEKLVELLGTARDVDSTPVFQVVLALQNAPWTGPRLGELEIEVLDVPSREAKFLFNMTLTPREDGGLGGVLEYRAGLFDAGTMERLAARFTALLEAAAADPSTRFSDLPLLTSAEEIELVREWSGTAVPYPREVPVHHLVAARAEEAPEALAVAAEGARLTYGELVARARRLARRLRSLRVGPETRVAVLMERSPEMVVAQLAVLEAGGAYVPLDPAHPWDRLLWQLEDAWRGGAVRVLLTQEKLGLPDPEGAAVLRIDASEAHADAGGRARFKPVPVLPENAAYVIYTSGSTGRPKGVVVPHGALANLVEWHRRAYGVTPADRASLTAGPGFDASVWEIWPYLAAGASLHVPGEAVRAEPGALASWLAGESVTLCFLPTPLAESLLKEPWPEGSALRALLTGGDRLHHGPRPGLPFALFNHYGPTENTVVATRGEAAPGVPSPPIGRPIANVRAHVLDRSLRPVPVGIPGELAVGGEGLARGYLHRPDLTAERFVPDPFAELAGGRLYRTGDLVRWLPGGELEFLGRTDLQVKIRGVRIELGEIEAVLTGHPEVREAVVLAREVPGGEHRLTAYFVPGRDGLAAESLRRFLLERLPEPMVPSAWVSLPSLPLTPNGKVDRQALLRTEGAEPRETAVHVAPRTPVEELLAGIWSDLLGVGQVGIHDDFFALGGHSLQATRLLSQVRSALGVELPVRRLFEASTLEAQAAAVEAARGVRAVQEPPLVRLPQDGGPLPLSFAQQRLWFLEQFEPANPTYNIPAAVRLTGPLDVAALERALAGVVERHQTLRSRFPASDGTEPVVVIEPRMPLRLTPEDVEDEESLPALAREEALRPFDIAAGPLVRARLLRLAPANSDHVLLLTMHHIVSDGWSMGILVREVAALYEGRELPELPIQYTDFAAWQRRWLEGEAMEREVAWWRDRLAGAPAHLELPTDRPRPRVKTSRGALRRAVLPAALAARLRETGRRSGGTLFMTLLAGLSALLHRYSRQSDVLVGSPIANRNRAEVEPLIGFFVNTLVLRADLSGDPSFAELLARVRDAAMAAYDHQDLPFEKVVEAVRPDRDLGRSPLFQVAFALQNLPIPELRLGGLTLSPVPTGGGTAKFDWDIAMEEIAGTGEIQVRWGYNTDLFDPATIERAVGQLRSLFEAAAELPGGRVSALPLLCAAERHALEVEWNAPDEYPSDLLVHERIESEAARRPGAPALLLDGEALTYGELDRRANRLANRLRRMGAGPESLVGVCLERSFELVVSLLAVLKAGAAYLPLDPHYPRERLRFMLRDSGVGVLVADEKLIGDLFGEDSGGLRTLALDADADRAAIEAESDRPPGASVDPDHPAYVIYTSGSTGVPKGVVISHRALANRLGWASVTDIGETDVLLQKTSVSFDVSVYEIFGPLTVGAREVLVRSEMQRDVDGLLGLVAEHGVTRASFPPSLLYVLMEREGFDEAFRPMRILVTGGEVVPADLPGRLHARLSPGARIQNRYGPTEATISVTCWTCRPGIEERVLPIGRPIAGAEVYVLDPAMGPVPVGVPGEIYLGGVSLARGYLHRPELTAEKFVPDPFSIRPGERLYRTGDLARYRPDGALEFVGRVDGQVKIRGFRVELGEIEAVLARHPGVREVAVIDREESAAGEGTATRVLVAYFVPEADRPVDGNALRDLARTELPAHMVPSAFVPLERLPLGPTGKVDRRALPAPSAPSAPERVQARREEVPEAPGSGLEERIAAIWREVLEVGRVGLHENFFDLGGHSLLMARVHGRLQKELGRKISMVELFQYPTVAALAAHLGGEAQGARVVRRRKSSPETSKIAIVGMAGRFPRAADAGQFWRNLCSGVEAVSTFSDEELLAQGIEPALLADPRYVRAAGVLDGADLFDADFFGVNPREAELTDPQHRVFLECAWEALESAGYGSGSPGPVGVYAGASFSSYLGHIAAQGALGDGGNPLMGNDKDFLATRVSYKLNLRGPSLTVQTACSTSLVAVHLACQALLSGECEMALAGGVSIAVPLKGGYVYQEGAIHSPDGRCRAFDAEAAGTPRGAGAGAVVLKRLEDAVADGDTIHAVILGSAINNDGSGKVGFTAPSVDGQAAVIAEAQAAAGIDPATVGYIEAHGTGTRRGDPIELAALAQAFGPTPADTARCAVVSSKPNIGHLDAAAGVASLIKAAFAVREGLVPPTLNFERLNPDADLEGTPFFVNTELRGWPIEDAPRRAGVSSFGIGGTNAHLVLEEPPAPAPSSPSQPWQLLLLSARTEAALEAATERLARYLEDHPDVDLADVAFTLRVGRRAFPYRRMAVCRDVADAVQALRDPRRIVSGLATDEVPEAPGARAKLEEHLDALGRFWLAGGQPDWDGVQTGEKRRRIALPAYPFERRRYWIDARPRKPALERRPDPADWTYVPGWKRTPPPLPPAGNGESHQAFLFLDEDGLGAALAARLEEQGWSTETVSRGDDFGARLAELVGRGWRPRSIVHLWQDPESLGRLAQLLDLAKGAEPVDVTVVTDGVQDVVGGEASCPERARVLGPCRVLAKANRCRWVDIDRRGDAADLLAAEVTAALPDLLVAHRGGHRWVRTYEPVRLSRRLAVEATVVPTGAGTRAVLDALSGTATAATAATAATGFVVLSSSLAAVVGGDAEDVALGAFAGALAEGSRAGGPRVLAVDWDPDVKPEEAAELLPRLLASGLPRVVVSTRDLEAVLRAGEDRPEAGAPRSRAAHPRPALSTPFVAPRTELEIQLAGLWRDLLGIEGVGADDNFFELGGHSLLATQLISQVRDRFGTEIKFARFFDAPTVTGLAAAIVERQAAAVEEAALAELLAEIQGLSAEDLQDQLAAEKQSLMEDGSS